MFVHLVAQLCPTLCVTLWNVARQFPLSMGFSRQEYHSGCHFLLQGIFPTQGSNLSPLHWQTDSLPLSHHGSPQIYIQVICKLTLIVALRVCSPAHVTSLYPLLVSLQNPILPHSSQNLDLQTAILFPMFPMTPCPSYVTFVGILLIL